ncbi:hypothetical protein PPO43_05415 [Saprospira sp. CCB-QB6]|uniref:hypothetical protein n=1 Tax=Saprospira sp. CCB-QB6 TaxID=3023936 RepID=UPI00234A0202|nr:hypothetical protein [Saprospira sp. CCB-QB6]WCL82536.1 hypothetical protein PPO43_05415 [Saprospira sp. CCB-QB6]
MSENTLSLELLPSLKKAEYEKLFKKLVLWKKAKAVIFLQDYRLAGKKNMVAIPYKKAPEMILAFKGLKKDSFHPIKKTAAASFSLEPTADGLLAKVEIKKGGLGAELIQSKMAEAFAKMNIILEFSTAEEASPLVDATSQDSNWKEHLESLKTEWLPAYKANELSEEQLADMQAAQNELAQEEDANAQKLLAKLEQLLAAATKNEAGQTDNELAILAQKIETLTEETKKTVLAHLKANAATDKDLDTIQNLEQNIFSFQKAYEQANEEEKVALAKKAENIQTKLLAQAQTLKEKVKAQAPSQAEAQAAEAEFAARLNELEALINAKEAEIKAAEKALEEKPEAEPLPSGADFLSFLF